METNPGNYEHDRRSLQERVRTLLASLRPRRGPARASFDPVRVEDELYDALYGARTGTVDNIVPLRSQAPRETGLIRRSRGDHSDLASRPARDAIARN
jgi:hypothetical protein